jgi:type II restriction enzyme
MTAQQVYDKLINEEQILKLEGQIRFCLGNVSIIVKQRDVVGNIMQEWLQGWLDANNIEYAPSENTQMPPDFFLNPDDKRKNLLEVKAFNRNAGPGFDIADFRMYSEEIIEKPYMLDVDYMIFGYDMSDDGVVTIKDVWLKKVWEITRRMKDWSINLQIKNNVVHKIRPGIWYSDRDVDYSIFESLEDFISAMEETVYQNPKTHNEAANWKNSFIKNYRSYYGNDIVIPRWNEIKDKYDMKAIRKHNKAIEEKENAIEQFLKWDKKIVEISEKLEQTLSDSKHKKLENELEKAKEQKKKASEKIENAQNKIDEA